MATTTYSGIITSMTNINKKQRLTLFINPEIVKQAKVQAIVEGLTLTTFVEKVLVTHLPKEVVVKRPENG